MMYSGECAYRECLKGEIMYSGGCAYGECLKRENDV